MYMYYEYASIMSMFDMLPMGYSTSVVYCEEIVYTGESDEDVGPQPVSSEWWAEYVKPEDEEKIELSGKLVLLFEILRMSEEIGDKV